MGRASWATLRAVKYRGRVRQRTRLRQLILRAHVDDPTVTNKRLAALLGVQPPQFSRIVNGRRRLLPEHVAKLIGPLRLTRDEAQELLEEAELSRAKRPLQDLVQRLRKRVEELERKRRR